MAYAPSLMLPSAQVILGIVIEGLILAATRSFARKPAMAWFRAKLPSSNARNIERVLII